MTNRIDRKYRLPEEDSNRLNTNTESSEEIYSLGYEQDNSYSLADKKYDDKHTEEANFFLRPVLFGSHEKKAKKYQKISFKKQQQGKIDEAIEAYSRAIQHNYGEPSYYFNRSALYEYKGDYNAAMADMRRAINFTSNENNKFIYKVKLMQLSLTDFETQKNKTLDDYFNIIDFILNETQQIQDAKFNFKSDEISEILLEKDKLVLELVKQLSQSAYNPNDIEIYKVASSYLNDCHNKSSAEYKSTAQELFNLIQGRINTLEEKEYKTIRDNSELSELHAIILIHYAAFQSLEGFVFTVKPNETKEVPSPQSQPNPSHRSNKQQEQSSIDWSDFDEVLEAVKKDGLLLEKVSPKLKNNVSICNAAVLQNREAEQFVPQAVKDNPNYVGTNDPF